MKHKNYLGKMEYKKRGKHAKMKMRINVTYIY